MPQNPPSVASPLIRHAGGAPRGAALRLRPEFPFTPVWAFPGRSKPPTLAHWIAQAAVNCAGRSFIFPLGSSAEDRAGIELASFRNPISIAENSHSHRAQLVCTIVASSIGDRHKIVASSVVHRRVRNQKWAGWGMCPCPGCCPAARRLLPTDHPHHG